MVYTWGLKTEITIAANRKELPTGLSQNQIWAKGVKPKIKNYDT